MEQGNTANIFFPESQLYNEGFLVGYNLEGFYICISMVVPFQIFNKNKNQEFKENEENKEVKIEEQNTNVSINELNKLLKTQKLQSFKEYCNGGPRVLGIIKSTSTANQFINDPEVKEFKEVADLWILIERTQAENIVKPNFIVKDFLICEYNYRVVPNFMIYPSLKVDEFISYTGLNYSQFMNEFKDSKQNKVVIPNNIDLFQKEKLTDFQFLLRQINVSKFLELQINEYLHSDNKDYTLNSFSEPFIYDVDFYVINKDNEIKQNNQDLRKVNIKESIPSRNSIIHWMKSLPLPLMFLKISIILCTVMNKFLSPIIWINELKYKVSYIDMYPEPLTLINAKRKLNSLRKISYYIKCLKSKDEGDVLFVHYRKLALWLKLVSTLSQMLFDCIFGIAFLIFILFYSKVIILNIKSILSWTEISFLSDQIRWAMGFLAEIKPNPELDKFLGRILLDLLGFWSSITAFTAQFEESSAKYLVAPLGMLGISFQSAIAYDILVVITIHIHTIFYIFGFAHKISFEILATLFHMFRGKKYNVLKKKVDDAIYSIEELLLGMLIMTIILFILPTMSIYYLSLIYLMCIIILFQVSLIIFTKTISTLPIF